MRLDTSEEPTMRGDDRQQSSMFSYVAPEARAPQEHPLRAIRTMTDQVLRELSPRFTTIYSPLGRPSIPPEMLLRALLLQVLYTVRSERLLMGDIAQAFFDKVLKQARGQQLLSDEHFTVDGTLVEAWAGHKSFKKKGAPPAAPPDDPGNPTVDFHGEKRSNATHASTTDPDARLYRKTRGSEPKLCYLGHALMENRNGLVIDTQVTMATGYAERDAALAMLDRIPGDNRITLGGDKGYDAREFVEDLRDLNVTPHLAQNTSKRSSAVDGRTTRHAGYTESQKKRKRVEEIFGWLKTVGLMRKTRHRGVLRVGWMFTFAAAVYNLVRIRNLTEVTT